jgi:hypothetical protein
MPFARLRRVDLYLSAAAAAAARRLISVGDGGARFSAARRRRRGVLRLLTQFHTFCSVYFLQFYQDKSAFYLLFNKQAEV